jgi:hypothetical protein
MHWSPTPQQGSVALHPTPVEMQHRPVSPQVSQH